MPRGYAGEAASPRAGDTADVAHAGVDHLRVPPVPPRHSRVRSYLRPCLVPRHRGGELVLKGDVGVVADAHLDLADLTTAEGERRLVLLAHRVTAVATHAQALATQREVGWLRADLLLGDDPIVDVELGRPVGGVALVDGLLVELHTGHGLAGLQAVGDELLLGRDADEVVDVVELAVLDEQGVTAEPRSLGEDHSG